MQRSTFTLSVIAGLTLALGVSIGWNPQIATADGPSVDTLLGIDQPDCYHIIDLLARNRARRFSGHAAPVGGNVLGSLPLPGDLELLEVHLISDGAVGQGPVFQVSFRNTSRWPVHNFQISVVGVLERITPDSPCRSIRIPCINAGETKCMEIQLPVRCMALGRYGGPLAPFDTLVVALDSFDELVECNELNNVAIVRRADIQVLVAAAPATAVPPSTTDPNVAGPKVAGPNAAAPREPAPADGIAPAPMPTDKPTPIENIDLDKLDLDSAQETAQHAS